MKSRRTIVAASIVALWVVGMAMMVRRNANRSDAQKLVEVALRLQPATFYYTVSRDGEQIGAASSALDTTSQTLVSEEYFVGDYPSGNAVERTSARWQTRLTRGFRLADLTIDVARPTLPFAMAAAVQQDTTLFVTGNGEGITRSGTRQGFIPPIFTPSLAPVLFMLSGAPKIGRTQKVAIFDPLTRAVLEPDLTIRAESLFTVVDSAVKDSEGNWNTAHRDTVRAWRLEGAPYGVSAWVDAEGRIVTATAGSFAVTRTAFEIAFKNSRAR
ncbi:MAG TPA: hypothetical protein VM166_12120 [Gemmatimonadaceae bacterium]|nr:hypothetical protein [Gemmatimonadaceae bacterium]